MEQPVTTGPSPALRTWSQVVITSSWRFALLTGGLTLMVGLTIDLLLGRDDFAAQPRMLALFLTSVVKLSVMVGGLSLMLQPAVVPVLRVMADAHLQSAARGSWRLLLYG